MQSFLNCCTFFETILKLTARIQVTWASSEVVAEVTIWLKCWGCWRISRQFKATAAGIVKGRGRQIAYNTNKQYKHYITSTLGLFWFLLVCFIYILHTISYINLPFLSSKELLVLKLKKLLLLSSSNNIVLILIIQCVQSN